MKIVILYEGFKVHFNLGKIYLDRFNIAFVTPLAQYNTNILYFAQVVWIFLGYKLEIFNKVL